MHRPILEVQDLRGLGVEDPVEILERSPPPPEGPVARDPADPPVILALQVILDLKEMPEFQEILDPKEIPEISIQRQMELPEIPAVHQVCWG